MPKILIVDDEWLTRLEIEEMLTDLGYDVAGQAETGAEAVAMARELNPDLILMDVEMPGEMNGIAAAREIKAELGTPIVFISGYDDPEHIEAAKEIAPFGYVMKPFDEREIHAFVEIALSKRKLELELEEAHERLEQTNLYLHKEIAARKKTENALRESQKLYRDIFEKNNANKWLLDPSSGKIIDANPAACEFYQYSRKEITKLHLTDINVEKEDGARKLLASISSNENTEFTAKHRLASGEIRDVQVYSGTLESGGKKLIHSIIIDITDRMRAEEALKDAHDELEKRVLTRTSELASANRQLQGEEEALRENEKRLNAILDATTETIVLFDRNGIVHVANQVVCDRLETPKEEFVGKRIYDFFPPDVAEGRKQKWKEVFDTGKPVNFEDSRKGLTFEQRAYPVLDEEGQVQMVVAFANDKTDHRLAEEALRESEEHLRSFMENAKGFVAYRLKIDPKDYHKAHVVFVSPNLKDVIGVSPQEEFSEWFKNIHDDDLPTLINAQNESTQSGVPLDQEFRLKGLEGEWRWLHVISNPVFDSEGKPEYYNGITIDITEQKQATQALREKERFHEELLNDMITFVAVLEPSGDVIFVNNTPLTVGGINLEDIRGKKFFDAFWWTHSDEVREMIKRDIEQCASGESIVHDVPIQTADGSLMWIEFSMHAIHDEYGVVQYLIPEGRDITGSKEAEKDRKYLETQLQRAQEMEAIGTLAGGVAHDLNNILGGLVSYPELLLLQLPEDSPLRKSILTIQKSGEKAAAVVQDLLTLARRGVVVTEVVNLNDVIAEYLKSPEYEKLQSYHRAVHLEAHLQKDVLNILGSSTHLSKTVMNLVSNAAEAMPDGGKLTVSTENRYIDRPIRGYDDVKEADYVVLTISDTGTGISTDDLEKIFEPFYTKKKMGRSGTGLGMAVVWGTVKDHNGYIDVKSTEGKGTTFTLYFPVTRKSPEERSVISLKDYMGKGEAILVVDDVEEQRKIASGMLKELGYSVAMVSSGEEAVEYLTTHKVHLI
jgi:PAS domain S-box-containing protein